MKTLLVRSGDGLWLAPSALLEQAIWPIERAAPTPALVNTQLSELTVHNLTVSGKKQCMLEGAHEIPVHWFTKN